MHTTLKTSSKKHKLSLSGEIGFAETNELWDAVQQIAQQPRETQIEWSNLSRIHYAGVQTLFALRKSLAEQGHTLQFGEPSPNLYQQLHTFGVWDALIQS